MITPLQLKLLKRLDSIKLNRRSAVRFKDTVFRLERTIKRYHAPHVILLKGTVMNKQYLRTKNYEDHFKITSKKYRIPKESSKRVRLIPVHIKNVVHGKSHFILFMIKGKSVYRIDPTFESRSHIRDKNVKKSIQEYFKGYRYKGYPKWNKNIRHGGLCRWVTPLIYLYRKKLNYNIIKRELICYFLKLLK
jgi:hypothetical protein